MFDTVVRLIKKKTVTNNQYQEWKSMSLWILQILKIHKTLWITMSDFEILHDINKVLEICQLPKLT